MSISQAFALLRIPACKDVPTIKKAYQKMLPHHHPEVDPEGFMQLHEAYKLALNYAQDKIKPTGASTTSFSWQPDTARANRNITDYDDLFADPDDSPTADPEQQKKAWSRALLRLKLHWLPIPLKKWIRFFGSETYLLCRTDAARLEQLFDLVLGKIHTYPVFCCLLERLWELDSWLYSEGHNDLSAKTRSCITELRRQYPHYLKLGSRSRISRWFLPLWWYYQALPFYFKLLAASFAIPLLSLGSENVFLMLLVYFYILELCIWSLKSKRQQGIFRPTFRKNRRGSTVKCQADNGRYIPITIYALMGHMWLCLAVMEAIMGLLA